MQLMWGEKGEFAGIRIREVHLEEDPAAWNPDTGTVDYNRSGAPLCEIVTEPDFHSEEEVVRWIKTLLLTLSYIKVLNKDSGFKSDVNISLHGDRIEIKNMNSIAEIRKAIIYEAERQKTEKPLIKETRAWDGKKTIIMRKKQSHADYRFLKDPDLPILKITKSEVSNLKSNLPETPAEKVKKLTKTHKLSAYDASVLTKNLEVVELFETIIKTISPKTAIPWLTVELLGALNYNKLDLDEVSLDTQHLTKLLSLIQNKKITELNGKDILRAWIKAKKTSSVNESKFKKVSSEDLEPIIKKVIKDNPKAVEDLKSDPKAMNFLVGQVMRHSNKRADFKTAKDLLEKELK